jgi:hypothetical protein
VDAAEGFRAWDVKRIQQELLWLLEREKYNFVVVLLPTNDTHGHHKTVALMTLEVIADLNPTDRPITLGVRTIGGEATFDLDLRPKNADELSCRARLQRCSKLEHKSQGAFQMEINRRTHECFWAIRRKR